MKRRHRLKVTFDNGRKVKSQWCSENEAKSLKAMLEQINDMDYFRFNTRCGMIFIPKGMLDRCTVEIVKRRFWNWL